MTERKIRYIADKADQDLAAELGLDLEDLSVKTAEIFEEVLRVSGFEVTPQGSGMSIKGDEKARIILGQIVANLVVRTCTLTHDGFPERAISERNKLQDTIDAIFAIAIIDMASRSCETKGASN